MVKYAARGLQTFSVRQGTLELRPKTLALHSAQCHHYAKQVVQHVERNCCIMVQRSCAMHCSSVAAHKLQASVQRSHWQPKGDGQGRFLNFINFTIFPHALLLACKVASSGNAFVSHATKFHTSTRAMFNCRHPALSARQPTLTITRADFSTPNALRWPLEGHPLAATLATAHSTRKVNKQTSIQRYSELKFVVRVF